MSSLLHMMAPGIVQLIQHGRDSHRSQTRVASLVLPDIGSNRYATATQYTTGTVSAPLRKMAARTLAVRDARNFGIIWSYFLSLLTSLPSVRWVHGIVKIRQNAVSLDFYKIAYSTGSRNLRKSSPTLNYSDTNCPPMRPAKD